MASTLNRARPGVLLIRADASTRIGTGHVMRCLALAHAWQERGGRVVFKMVPGEPALETRLRTTGIDVLPLSAQAGSENDAAQTAETGHSCNAEWVVVDGYHFQPGYIGQLRKGELRVLALDDTGLPYCLEADMVLNQNISARETLYAGRAPHTQLLMGTKYALLRREFSGWNTWQRSVPPRALKLLVTLGGSDADNVTLRVIHVLQQVRIEGMETVVVCGASNPHRASLELAVKDTPAIRLQSNVTSMPPLMAWADVAISAAGSTCWEMAFMRLPALLIVLAENQLSNAVGLDEAGAALNLGWFDDLSDTVMKDSLCALLADVERRQQMSRYGRTLVDGMGTARVVTALLNSPFNEYSLQGKNPL